MPKHNRTLIIGLDGGTWKVLEPMMNGGVMPNLKQLVENGISGVLNSTLPPLTPPAFATFHTGVSPSKHGIYAFTQHQSGSYKPTFVSSRSLQRETIWTILSKAGKRIILVGVPMTYPPQKINGIVISGLMTPSIKSDFVLPSELKDELLNKIGEYRFVSSPTTFYRKGLEAFLADAIFTERKRLEATQYIFNKYEWDIGMIHFQSVDNLQHTLWPLMDPETKQYSLSKWKQVSTFFEFIDTAIGRLIKLAGHNTNIVIISDHGHGPLTRSIRVNRWLEHKGFLRIKSSLKTQSALWAIRLFKSIDFLKFRRVFISLGKRHDVLNSITQGTAIDWPKTSAYMSTGSQTANIYINLKGREPNGAVAQEDYETVRRELRNELEHLKDPETGNRAIKRVYYREEIASDNCELVPDLLVEPEDGYYLSLHIDDPSIFKSHRFGREEVGSHRKEGIYVLAGPDFGRLSGKRETDIVNVPATILALMGVKAPSYFDGKTMDFALKHHQGQTQEHVDLEGEPTNQHTEVYSQSDEKQIEKLLKDLGYL